MSDKELVELIRSAPWSDGFPYLKETADRIEELEAKLAKAIEAIKKMQVSSDAMMLHVARTTLAELTKRLK